MRNAFPILVLGLAAGLPAQASKIIPASVANVDGNSSTPYFSGYGAGRAQILYDGAAVCNSACVITGMQMRADGVRLAAIPGRSFAQLKVTLGPSGNSPSSMSTMFAANRKGTQTTMFSGAYNLPAQNATSRPFNIAWTFKTPFAYARSMGNLLLEFEVPGQPSKANYFIDVHNQSGTGGSVGYFGTAGRLSGSLRYSVSVNAATLTPGGRAQLDVKVSSFLGTFPAFALWGASSTDYGPIKLPLDLGFAGAANNFLNVSPDLALGFVVQRGVGQSAFKIPNNPWLGGKTIYAQAMLRDTRQHARLGVLHRRGSDHRRWHQPPADGRPPRHDQGHRLHQQPRSGRPRHPLRRRLQLTHTERRRAGCDTATS